MSVYPNRIMNCADLESEYTRIHEFKHFHPERKDNPKYRDTAYAEISSRTVIVREYSKTWHRGEYTYYDMNKTIAAALSKFEKIKSVL